MHRPSLRPVPAAGRFHRTGEAVWGPSSQIFSQKRLRLPFTRLVRPPHNGETAGSIESWMLRSVTKSGHDNFALARFRVALQMKDLLPSTQNHATVPERHTQ